jgi:flagellar hook assembly protein FlgD/outer membrane protein OmpA-like peptidoglycan-associated protein
VTSLDSPWADRLNPAASAGQQRTVLAAGYEALADLGSTKQGVGTALALGLSLPENYGVLGAGLRLVSTPTAMSSMPLGTVVVASGSISKALFPNLYVGAGLDLAFGGAPIAGGTSLGWGAGLDLGFIHFLGDRGPFLDLRWGGALSGIGKAYSTTAATTGVLGGATASGFPPAFTPSFGAEALFVRSADWKLGAGAQLAFPTFQDLALSLSAKLAYKGIVSLGTSWGFDLRELIAGSSRSLIPSFALSATIPIERKSDASFISEHGWDKSEVVPTLSARPLYGSVWGLGAGVVLPLGVVDKTPPAIKASFPATEWGPAYVSPNSDGAKDSLAVPLTITDQRYVAAFSLRVYRGDLSSPSDTALVRSIVNKETRPETADLAGLWKRLTYVEKGVAVPPELVWDGRADDGSNVADGSYTVFIAALDDNGNKGIAGPYKVVVDSSAPQAAITPEDPSLIFSPDGDGNKDTIAFRLVTSVEDLWSLAVLDAGGAKVRGVEYRSAAPDRFVWDGKTDSGVVAPDGVYSIVLSSTDRAGNAAKVRVDNIIVNTQQPPINIAIDQASFSPNGDGVKDSLAVSPSVPVKTGVVSWRLFVVDKNKIERWSSGGTDGSSIPARLSYDGKDSKGAVLPEGQYQAGIAVTYANGHSPKVLSPVFTIDLTPPSGTVQADKPAFNPAGQDGQNRVAFAMKGSHEDRWTASIYGADPGKALRTWSMGAEPDASVEWDGADDQGKPLPDGSYSLRLASQDKAGNAFLSGPVPIILDTEKKAVRLSADARAFSPNGDGVKDAIHISDSVLAKDKLKSFVLTIETADQAAAAMKTWKGASGSALLDSYTWDGTDVTGLKAPDGRYLARIKVAYQNGDSVEAQTPIFVIDTVAPSLSASGSPLLFSPNGDGRLDAIAITQSSSVEDSWEGRILAADGSVIRSYAWKGQAPSFTWDGTDEAGNPVKDGVYRYEAAATDAAGNKASASVSGITVDTRATQVFLTASETGISPNGDGFKDSVSFTPVVNLKDGISAWKLAIMDKSGAERRVFAGTKDLPARVEWDGKDDKGAIVQGEFSGALTVDYAKGDRATAKSSVVLVDTEGPKVLLSLSPELFSPDNDGVDDELTFSISVSDVSPITDWKLDIDETAVVEGGASGAKPAERLFISWGGSGVPAPSIVWDGRSAKGELVEAATDYPYYFTIRDALGNVAKLQGALSVDVLVLKDGDRLKIKVPSIVFRANYADFVGLDGATLDRNAKVIKRIAQILNRFRDYKIGIEGHANSEGKIGGYSAAKIAEEEQKELIPLSLGRAELVRKLLIADGVDAGRLSTIGMGSSEPVVDFKDSVNRWKNRRVEFVLIKK